MTPDERHRELEDWARRLQAAHVDVSAGSPNGQWLLSIRGTASSTNDQTWAVFRAHVESLAPPPPAIAKSRTDKISGYVERVTFANEETGWTVARLKEAGKSDLTTVVGNLLAITPGESLELSGKWVTDKKYGPQFRVESYTSVVPATVNGIEKYLSTSLRALSSATQMCVADLR